MTYDKIMEEIKSGLTGDTKVDMKYLMTQMDKYKEHELSQEIIRACGRMIASIMPEDAKEEFNNLIRKEELNIDSALDEMHFAVYKKDYQRALDIIEALVQKADEKDYWRLQVKEEEV